MLIVTTITKPPEVIVNKFLCLCVCFFSSCFHAVERSLPRYYLNDLSCQVSNLAFSEFVHTIHIVSPYLRFPIFASCHVIQFSNETVKAGPEIKHQDGALGLVDEKIRASDKDLPVLDRIVFAQPMGLKSDSVFFHFLLQALMSGRKI